MRQKPDLFTSSPKRAPGRTACRIARARWSTGLALADPQSADRLPPNEKPLSIPEHQSAAAPRLTVDQATERIGPLGAVSVLPRQRAKPRQRAVSPRRRALGPDHTGERTPRCRRRSPKLPPNRDRRPSTFSATGGHQAGGHARQPAAMAGFDALPHLGFPLGQADADLVAAGAAGRLMTVLHPPGAMGGGGERGMADEHVRRGAQRPGL